MAGRQTSCRQPKRPLHSRAAVKMSQHIRIGPEPVLATHAPSPPAAGSHCPAREDSAPPGGKEFFRPRLSSPPRVLGPSSVVCWRLVLISVPRKQHNDPGSASLRKTEIRCLHRTPPPSPALEKRGNEASVPIQACRLTRAVSAKNMGQGKKRTKKIVAGEPGYRSLRLPHAKRALYQ
jgi:hypothetical protein